MKRKQTWNSLEQESQEKPQRRSQVVIRLQKKCTARSTDSYTVSLKQETTNAVERRIQRTPTIGRHRAAIRPGWDKQRP